jgi:hypothetical protein
MLGLCNWIHKEGFKRTSRLVMAITTLSILALLVACSSSEKMPKSNEEKVIETAGSPIDKNTKDAPTLFHAESCEQIEPFISEYVNDLDFIDETSYVDSERISCFWMNLDKPLETLTITGYYHNENFMTNEEIRAYRIFEVFHHDRVEAFGGAAYGMSLGDAAGTTAVGTKDFEISMTLGESNLHLYGEPAIEVLLRFIEE